MGFECRFFTRRPMVAWPIGVFDRRVSAVRQVRWHSGGDSPLHKERLWALRDTLVGRHAGGVSLVRRYAAALR